MARRYLFGQAQKSIGYGMEECEERVLIATYHEIEPTIRPGADWKVLFETQFYSAGNGVSRVHLDHINSERRRHRLAEFEIIETKMFVYGKETDRAWKAKRRCELRDEYLELKVIDKITWIDNAKTLMQRQPTSLTPVEFFTPRDPSGLGSFSQREYALRRAALKQDQPPVLSDEPVIEPVISSSEHVLPSVLAVDKAIRLLNISTRENTILSIITRLHPDDALLVAESGKLTDDDLIDKLVQRSLEAA